MAPFLRSAGAALAALLLGLGACPARAEDLPPPPAGPAGVPHDAEPVPVGEPPTGAADGIADEAVPSDAPASEEEAAGAAARDDTDADPAETTSGGEAHAKPDAAGDGEGQGDAASGEVISREAILDVVEAPEASGSARSRQRLVVHGRFSLRYRWRQTDDDHDHDLYQHLVLTVGHERRAGFSGSFHGRLTEDLDGTTDSQGFYVFDSITDTYDHRVNGRIYHAYVTWRSQRGFVEQVRIGRQYVEGGDLFHLDGARVDFRGTDRLQGGVYGGLPAHIFESSPEGDLLVGFFVEGVPWQGGRARLDFAYIEDETSYYGALENAVTTLTLRQQFSAYTNAWGALQLIDEDPRMLRLQANTFVPARDLSLRAAFYGLLDTQEQRVTEVDPYYVITQELKPYWTGSLAVSKGISRRFYVEGGIDVRQLFDGEDASRYNHSFQRYYATVQTENWPARNLFVSLTGERWNSGDDYWSTGVEVEHRPSKRFRIQVGTDYSLYKFDLYTADERQSVRSYYVRVVARPNDRWRMHLRMRLEDDAFDTYFVLDTGFDLEF